MALMIVSFKETVVRIARVNIIIVIMFTAFSLNSLMFSEMPFTESFYGISGRYNGFLTYLMFMVLMLASAIFSNPTLLDKLLFALAFLGFLSSSYGILQFLGLDPLDPIAKYGGMIGFFGNPNFLSAYLGMTGVATFALTITSWSSKSKRYGFLLVLVLTLFVLIKINSRQGILIFLCSSVFLSILILGNKPRTRKLSLAIFASYILTIFLTLLDIFQMAPWKSVLYEYSISARGDFWRAAINMGKDNFMTGVGLDGYRDNFRLYRDLNAAIRDPNTPVNSSHNLLLDLFVGGGLPLVIIYFCIILLVLKSAFNNLRNNFQIKYAAVFCTWLAFQLQAIVSINQISIGVVGWILTGVLIGYKGVLAESDLSRKSSISKSASNVLAKSFAIALGLALTIPLFISDSNFRSAVVNGEVSSLINNIDNWPRSVERVNLTTNIFFATNNQFFAEKSARKAIELNKNNYEAWLNLYKVKSLSSQEKKFIFSMLEKLDPLNPTLK